MCKSAHVADELLTTRQVAERLRVTVATVNRWADTDRLPVAQKLPGITGANLFHSADVERIEAESNKATAEVAS